MRLGSKEIRGMGSGVVDLVRIAGSGDAEMAGGIACALCAQCAVEIGCRGIFAQAGPKVNSLTDPYVRFCPWLLWFLARAGMLDILSRRITIAIEAQMIA